MRVGEHIGLRHQVHERQILLRSDRIDVAQIAQNRADGAAHVRIQMHRIDQFDVVALEREFSKRMAYVLERFAETLASKWLAAVRVAWARLSQPPLTNTD